MHHSISISVVILLCGMKRKVSSSWSWCLFDFWVNEKCLMKNDLLGIFGGLVFLDLKSKLISKARFTTYLKGNECVVVHTSMMNIKMNSPNDFFSKKADRNSELTENCKLTSLNMSEFGRMKVSNGWMKLEVQRSQLEDFIYTQRKDKNITEGSF